MGCCIIGPYPNGIIQTHRFLYHMNHFLHFAILQNRQISYCKNSTYKDLFIQHIIFLIVNPPNILRGVQSTLPLCIMNGTLNLYSTFYVLAYQTSIRSVVLNFCNPSLASGIIPRSLLWHFLMQEGSQALKVCSASQSAPTQVLQLL